MDLSLTEEQRLFQQTVRDFATKELEPVAAEIDAAEEFAWENLRKMAELGLTGLLIPPEYGGSGGDSVMLVIAMEELARACASTSDILDAQLCLCTRPIYIFGNEEQRRKYLPPLISSKKVGAYAITEPEAGSDVVSMQTTATRDGDGYILNGTKIFITNGNVCDTVVVFANVDRSLGRKGITAFIVEKGTKGFSTGKKYQKLGMRGATNAELNFQDCRIPASQGLGGEGQGLRIAFRALDEGRIGIAAQALGIAQAVLERSVAYAKQRVQFGHPLAENQAIQWMIADMAVQVSAARLLTYQAALSYDSNSSQATLHAAMAKLYASEMAMQATIKGVQIHGGYGYMMDSPMQRYLRDVKLTEIYEGTSEVQRMVISRALLV